MFSSPLIPPLSPVYCCSSATGLASGGSCFGKIRLHCGGCWAGQGNQGKAVGQQVQIDWGEHKHLLLRWIFMFANWLKTQLFSLLRSGAGQPGTPLKMIRSSTFLDSQEFRYDYSAGRSFSANCGMVKSYSQKSLLCCLFILSDKRLFFISQESPCALLTYNYTDCLQVACF